MPIVMDHSDGVVVTTALEITTLALAAYNELILPASFTTTSSLTDGFLLITLKAISHMVSMGKF